MAPSGETVVYENWNLGEPNDWGSGEDCTELGNNEGKWNDIPCDGTSHVVCEESGKSVILFLNFLGKINRTKSKILAFKK